MEKKEERKITLDEAIKHCEEVVDEKKKEACNLYDAKAYEESRECIWCAEEHRQLAEWLKELKKFREQEPFINKPCVSSGVCEHDKQKILDKIREEIEQHRRKTQGIDPYDLVGDCLDIINKYKES